jgi:nitrogen fixation/metabolism regulation signal transduction histidine kinase
MELRREFVLMIGALVLLNLSLAFGAIGLFVRMGPAIERILRENVYSIVAAEEVLAELADAGDAPLGPEARVRVRRAVDNAKRNVTEAEERPVLATLERSLPSALEGERRGRSEVVWATRRMIQINREAMRNVDQEARRLGSAGAWAAVFVGLLSFLLSVFVIVRLQNRFVRPLVDLHQVLESARDGDRFRRCRLAAAPREITQVTQAVNRLLDERLERSRPREPQE